MQWGQKVVIYLEWRDGTLSHFVSWKEDNLSYSVYHQSIQEGTIAVVFSNIGVPGWGDRPPVLTNTLSIMGHTFTSYNGFCLHLEELSNVCDRNLEGGSFESAVLTLVFNQAHFCSNLRCVAKVVTET